MIVVIKKVPRSIITQAVLDDIQKCRPKYSNNPQENDYVMILVPRYVGGKPTTYCIAYTLRAKDIDHLANLNLDQFITNKLQEVLPASRVLYVVFRYSDIFRWKYWDELRYGHTAYALIEKLIAA